MLTQRELERYKRQIIMPDWGEEAQARLKGAKVMVAGAGGLGSAVLTYLAIAGVGAMRVVDRDTVELSNLNRQMLHADRSIGRSKAESAKERLEELNPDIEIEAVNEDITEANVHALVEGLPIVDAMDNLETRYLLNLASVKTGVPLFHGAVYGLEGRATTVIPGETPCIKCLYHGVLGGPIPVVGVAPGVIGCIQATEVIKYILGVGDLLTNRLLIYDGISLRFSEVKLKKDPACDVCR